MAPRGGGMNIELPTWLTLRTAFIIGAATAIVGFLLIDNYSFRADILTNIMYGQISLGEKCPPRDLIPPPSPGSFGEGDCRVFLLPYRWLLAGLVLFVAAVGVVERRR